MGAELRTPGIDIVFWYTKIANSTQCVWIVGIDIVFFGHKDCKFNQTYATSPTFWTNLHFRESVKI